MKRLSGIGFLAVLLAVAIAFMAQTECAMAEDGTILGEEGGEGIAQPQVTDIWLEDIGGGEITKIPKAKAFLIWVMWEPAKDQPKVIYRFKIQQDTTRTFKHKIVKKNTMTGIIGEACATAIVPWANSGQNVSIKVKVRDIGSRTETFQVE